MSGPALLSCRRVVSVSTAPSVMGKLQSSCIVWACQRPRHQPVHAQVLSCKHCMLAGTNSAQPSITGICSPVCCRITPHTAVSTTTSWTSAQHTAKHTHGHLVNSKTLPTISRPVGTCSSDSKTTHNHQQSQLAAA